MRPIRLVLVVSVFFTQFAYAAGPEWAGPKAKGKFVGTVRSRAVLGRSGGEGAESTSVQEQFLRRNGNKLTVSTRILDAFGKGNHSVQSTVGDIVESRVDANDQSTVLKVKFGGELNRKLTESAITRSFDGKGGMEVRKVEAESQFRFKKDGTVSIDSSSALERGAIRRPGLFREIIDNVGTGNRLSETSRGELRPSQR